MDKAKAIFKYAEVYARTARLINERSSMDPSYLLPSMVNAALSLELYFKALYYLLYNKEFKIGKTHSHDFSKIYDSFSASLKNEMSVEFDILLHNRNMNDVFHLEEKFGFNIPRKLRENLIVWSEVFVKIRYAYEPKDKSITMMFFPEIENVVVETTKRLYPAITN